MAGNDHFPEVRPGRSRAHRQATVLDGWDSRLLAWTLGDPREVLRNAAQRGLPPSGLADLAQLLDDLTTVGGWWSGDVEWRHAASELGSAVAEVGLDGAPSITTHPTLTVKDVAPMLGLTERQVRNLAPQLGGDKRGGTWLFPRETVRAYIERRSAA